MLGDLGLDLVDRDAALVGAQDIGQHFLDEGDVDRPAGHHRISGDAVERAFQLADRIGQPPGEELDDVARHVDAGQRLQLGLDDVEAQLVIGRVDVGDQAPATGATGCAARSRRGPAAPGRR